MIWTKTYVDQFLPGRAQTFQGRRREIQVREEKEEEWNGKVYNTV